MSTYFIDVGSRNDGTRSFIGDISALELYNLVKGNIPSSLKDLVIQNQIVKTYENIDDESPVKKKKKSQSDGCI